MVLSLGCKTKIPEELFKTLMSRLHLRPIQSDSLRVGRRGQYF